MMKHKQQGASLVVGLILLTVATVVSLSSMTGGSMQARMTSNQNNKTASRMAAEAGASRFIKFVNEKEILVILQMVLKKCDEVDRVGK
ncbi:MAG: pilus assembly PilX N-terminal domain-containing protein [Chromatiales bacterium]|nr:pilus assembly PilX N-terminal domain-containing protein [Chromatiales bacterium]